MYSPLSHFSLVRSKTGPPRRMFLTSKRATMSERVKMSVSLDFVVVPDAGFAASVEAPSVFGAGMPPPMRPRKLMTASGRKPAWR